MYELGALLAQDLGVCTWLSETTTARAGGAAVAFDFAFSADVAGLHFLLLLLLILLFIFWMVVVGKLRLDRVRLAD